jgi:hypothetical protein
MGNNIVAPDYDNLSVIVDDASLSMPQDVLGELWLWTPEFEFPERGWVDLVALVTDMFLLEAYLLLGGKRSASVLFMRGPCQIYLTVVAADTWTVEGVWRGASRTPPVAVHRALLIAQLLEAGRTLLKSCERRGWRPKSVVGLEVSVARLEREAAYRNEGHPRQAGKP